MEIQTTDDDSLQQELESGEKPYEQESSEKTIYHFDDPLLKESGYVEIFPNKVVLLFPEKISSTNYLSNVQNVQLYINKKLVFHYNWLPILTSIDLIRCKNMFDRAYSEYTALIDWNFWPGCHFYPQLYNESVSVYSNPGYTLTCFENYNTTSIELVIKPSQTQNPLHSFNVHAQIYVGPYLTFCSKSSLNHLDTNVIHLILSFILYKLTKY
jgi:hypothetical protein